MRKLLLLLVGIVLVGGCTAAPKLANSDCIDVVNGYNKDVKLAINNDIQVVLDTQISLQGEYNSAQLETCEDLEAASIHIITAYQTASQSLDNGISYVESNQRCFQNSAQLLSDLNFVRNGVENSLSFLEQQLESCQNVGESYQEIMEETSSFTLL